MGGSLTSLSRQERPTRLLKYHMKRQQRNFDGVTNYDVLTQSAANIISTITKVAGGSLNNFSCR